MTNGLCDNCNADINVDGNADHLWEHADGVLCDFCHDDAHTEADDGDDCDCPKWT